LKREMIQNLELMNAFADRLEDDKFDLESLGQKLALLEVMEQLGTELMRSIRTEKVNTITAMTEKCKGDI